MNNLVNESWEAGFREALDTLLKLYDKDLILFDVDSAEVEYTVDRILEEHNLETRK